MANKDDSALTVLIHGLEGAATDWKDPEGYSHGGLLTQALNNADLPWIALDLYGHGEWKAEEPEFNPANVSDELWAGFIDRSVDAIVQALGFEFGGAARPINLFLRSSSNVTPSSRQRPS